MKQAPLLILLAGLLAAAGATPPETGHLQLVFTERSPLSSVEALYERQNQGRFFATMTPTHLAHVEYDLSRESFDCWIPTDYDGRTRYGLFVWVGVTKASGEWLDPLARHKIIFIAANTYGRTAHQEGMALDAVHNMTRKYAIDPSRIYVAGFSAGGARATYLIRNYPEIFSGGYFMLGGYFYHNLPIDKKRWEPTTMPADPYWHVPIDQVKTRELLIMKGADDPIWTAPEGQADYEALLLDGFTRVNYIEIPSHGHNHPDAYWFEKGLEALEREPRKAPTTQPTKGRNLQPGQIAQAKRLLASAQWYSSSWSREAKEYKERSREQYEQNARLVLLQLIDQFPTSPAAAEGRKLLKKLDQLAATRAASTRATTRGTR